MLRCLLRIPVLFCLAFLIAAPVAAQIYSYRDAQGRLHITDRPIERKGFKLVDTYVPKDRKKKEPSGTELRNAQTPSRKGDKYVLSKAQINGLVVPIARSMKVDPALVIAVIEVESGRDARALSSKGAMGLMQLIPETAERFGVKNPWNVRENVRGGISYLQYLLSYFEGDVDLVLAAYNAGENAVDRHGGIPPYRETRRYVQKVRKLYKRTELPYTNRARTKSVLASGKGVATAG